jgi:maltose O-acetyltransferase
MGQSRHDFRARPLTDSNSSARQPHRADPLLIHVADARNEEIIGAIDRDRASFEERSRTPHRWGASSGHTFTTAPAHTTASTRSATSRLKQLLSAEFAGIHPRLTIARMLLVLLPIHVGGRVRSLILRLIGFQIGRGTIMAATPTITGDGDIYDRLVIGSGCWINIGCLFNLGAEIRIGSNVSIGHEVMVLTQSHEIGPSWHRALTPHAKPVNIGSGAWLGSRTTILPGVRIGAGAVVAAGSVVCRDVPPNTLVAGVPARALRQLS